MKMQLVGLSKVMEGISKRDNKPYMLVNWHFIGKSLGVEGMTVAKVKVDLLEINNLPELELGAVYDVDLSDKGYLRDIELVEHAPQKEAPAAPAQDKKAV